jgi:hypothetical protein
MARLCYARGPQRASETIPRIWGMKTGGNPEISGRRRSKWGSGGAAYHASAGEVQPLMLFEPASHVAIA